MKSGILKTLCILLVLILFCGCSSVKSPLKVSDESDSVKKGDVEVKQFESVNVGDEISFGSYKKDENDDAEALTWRVLSIDEGKALVIASDGIDCQLYNTEAIETSWEKCSLRKWLNSKFLSQAFSNDEQKLICQTEISFVTENFDTRSVRDKVFLLSVEEVEKYFSSEEERVCKPTAFALKNGVYTDASAGNCAWWLRDGGSSLERAAIVSESGVIDRSGEGVYCDGNAVRPAMWISLNGVPAETELTDKDKDEHKTPTSSSTTKPATTTKKSSLSSDDPLMPTDEPLSRPEKKEDIVNILVIGNSCAYYFMDELEGMASAAGLQVNVYNAYYSLSSGNQVDAHWSNLTIDKSNSDKNTYQFFKTAKGDRKQLVKSITLQGALSYTEWDVIVMNESVRPRKSDTYEAMYKSTVEDAKRIYDYIKEEHPDAALFWYQGFSYEIGWTASNDESEYMVTKERQDRNHENIKLVSKLICQQNEIGLLPVGDAWQIARENPLFGQHLTERWANGNHKEDHYHDGESGGQYLNACVFFEGIFQKSCVGNTFIPTAGGALEHELTKEKVAQLQKIAHEAVAAVYGEDFAKD